MNILLTSAGRRNYIVDYFKKSLAGIGKVYAANSTEISAALIAADKSFLVPPIISPNYIQTLINICHDYKIDAIIPLFDLDLPVLASAREKFAQHGISVVVSSSEVIEICNDKWKTHKFLIQIGIPTPKSFIDLESVVTAIEQRLINYPLIIKPRWGMGSIGLMEAENQKELEVFYSKVQRTIKRSYLAEISEDEPSHSVLIQEKLTGKEYGLDIVNDLRGEYVTTFVKEKIAMRSGETDAAVTVYSPQLKALGETLAFHLKHIANLDADVFVDDKKSYVLELNPRFGGGYPFSHLAGADIPSAIVAWLQHKTPDNSCFKAETGILSIKGILPMTISKN
jgi:carbamoyl-phosphate synthase large subunit